MTERIRVGTRRSRLARTQTEMVLVKLQKAAPDWEFETVPIDTSGDRDRSLGGSPDFTDLIDQSLIRGEIDLAVHSAKDLPVELDHRLDLLACPTREDPRDCLIVRTDLRARQLPRGARVGSSSLRRRAQLLRWRPDLDVVEIRGNVDTRIGLVRDDRIDAAVLAVAGITRLGRGDEIAAVLPSSRFLPAPAQGALAVVARAGDTTFARVVGRIDHVNTRASIRAERAFAAALGGDCRVPLGALATVRDRTLFLIGEVLTTDGRDRLRSRRSGPMSSAEQIGAQLGSTLMDQGASDLLRAAQR